MTDFSYAFRNQLPSATLSMLDGEEQIIDQAIQGEASAFGLLYDHYQSRIYRFVFIKVGRREEAEDLTHQIFLKAWTHIDSYSHRGFPFSSWLYRIARNMVVDFYRSRKPESSLEDVDPQELRVMGDEDSGLDHKLALESVRRAIVKLKPEHQDVIVLRFIEELSIAETAKLLKKSEGAVKVLQHRAFQKLKALLHDGS